MKRIKYICYYPSRDANKPRECVEAATTKIDYIVSVLNRYGIAVDIISPSIISAKRLCFSRGGITKLGENSLRLFPSFGCHNIALLRGLSRKITYCCFHRWLRNNLAYNETIIVYHSLDYCSFFINLKKSHRFKLIGEIEEIYQDVHPQMPKLRADEYHFFDICDQYLFPNTVLDEIINKAHKPSLVIHGVYTLQPKIVDKYSDGKTHVLYAGTFDPIKGGALAAAEAAAFLSENYHVHITGFGTRANEHSVRERVNTVSKKTKAKLTFHGFISREELIRLMQQCHIGLCTQDPTKELNLTSFPSKILFYMSNGLIVLSGHNRAIEESAVGDIVTYYGEQTPEAIATDITNIDLNTQNHSQERLIQLDNEFAADFYKFVSL